MHHLFKSKPTRVIHISGTDREMGQQHGELLRDVIHDSMPVFYHRMWTDFFKTNGFSGKMARKILETLFLRPLQHNMPKFLRERVEGTASATHLPSEYFYTAVVLPDLLPLLQSYMGKVGVIKFIEASLPTHFGCTSFISNGGNFLQGRNLDFPGVGYWDRHPVIQCMTPEKGLKSISFTTAGVSVGGITGINESQITVALHQHYSYEVALTGIAPFAISEKILSQAKSLDDALKIIQSFRLANPWAFVVADGKNKTAFICEVGPKTSGVRYLSRSSLTHSNFFQTDSCKANEYSMSARMTADNFSRNTCLKRQFEATEDIQIEEATALMSQHWDPYWEEEKVFNRTISQIYNIQSVVLDPVNMKAYFAEGNPPIHLGAYREYNLSEIFNGKEGKTSNLVPPYQFKDKEKRSAKENYIKAFVTAFEGELEKSVPLLMECLKGEFFPEIAQTLALVNLKLGEIKAAEGLLSKGKNFLEDKMNRMGKKIPPPEYFETTLYYARVLDLLGQREKALSIYQQLENNTGLSDGNIRKLAKKAGPYQYKETKKIVMPFSTYIPFV